MRGATFEDDRRCVTPRRVMPARPDRLFTEDTSYGVTPLNIRGFYL
jgi:hypothetical protein